MYYVLSLGDRDSQTQTQTQSGTPLVSRELSSFGIFFKFRDKLQRKTLLHSLTHIKCSQSPTTTTFLITFLILHYLLYIIIIINQRGKRKNELRI